MNQEQQILRLQAEVLILKKSISSLLVTFLFHDQDKRGETPVELHKSFDYLRKELVYAKLERIEDSNPEQAAQIQNLLNSDYQVHPLYPHQ